MKHSKKWILDHYECDGLTNIEDFIPFTDNVDNSECAVDNFSPASACYYCVRDNCFGCSSKCAPGYVDA